MSRITRTGANWLTPPAPQTAWQRERARGEILPMESEGWSCPPYVWGAVGIVVTLLVLWVIG